MTSDTALLVIDVQQGLFAENPFEPDRLLTHLKTLIDQARNNNVPVIYVQHNESPEYAGSLVAGTPAHAVHPSIAPQAGDAIVQKWTPDSFHNTNLQDVLTEKGIKHLVLGGMQTEMCVDTTCRSAFARGYDVVVASDAHTTMDNPVLQANQIIKHHNSTLRMFATIKPTAEITFT